MQFDYKYFGQSNVSSDAKQTQMNFAPDTLRSPTYFVADLAQNILFREAMGALHDVVVADLRFQPKNREEYFQWLEQEESNYLAQSAIGKNENQLQLDAVGKELFALRKQQNNLLTPYYKAQNAYFKYLYKNDYNAWFVLDPVITVHPDQVFFECFSQDESSYGKLSCNLDVFKNITDFECGTTNIDYSAELYNEFQKIRDYKDTQFKIDPTGFDVQTQHEEKYNEQKIDLPDSWVRGFLQVSSAMTLPMVSFELHPMDIHNFLFVLKRQKEDQGPRSIRFELTLGQPIKAVFEPWNHEVICKRSIYKGADPREIRIWGRRRLMILERLIPIAKKFTVNLLGTGLPSFFIADLGDLSFTLGLSGWTANDWSKMSNFDLMAPRAEVDSQTISLVYNEMKKVWFSNANALGRTLQLEKSVITSALSLLAQSGKVIFDLANNVYRLRELSQEPLPLDQLRFENEREKNASRYVQHKLVKIKNKKTNQESIEISGTIMDSGNTFETLIELDLDQRLIKANCHCHFYNVNKLSKGPCEHMIALRLFEGSIK
ncbi:SWIM zinc finger family protein [Marinicellulosiphila megalodicopiae]|uniref:SWIM zinc finger family protein n=1 Tax=Marinicellulosiphila megalodicopiae TaxID=2724896 RepID=UPI003BAE9E83